MIEVWVMIMLFSNWGILMSMLIASKNLDTLFPLP
jgi:hypothetical protein